MRPALVYMFHDHPLTGAYSSAAKTYDKIRSRFYWTNMFTDVTNYARSCLICQKAKGRQALRSGLLGTILATFPNEVVGIDFMGPFPRTVRGNEYILTIIDLYTKWAEAYPLCKATADECAHTYLYGWVVHHGSPLFLLSDRGQAFIGKLLNGVCYILNTKKINTSPYHAQGNGGTEKCNNTIGGMVRTAVSENHENWDLVVPLVMFAYRTTSQRSTDFKPFLLQTGREPILPTDTSLNLLNYDYKNITEYVFELRNNLQVAYSIASRNLQKAHSDNQEYYDRSHKPVHYNVGDFAWLYVIPRPKANQSSKFLHPWQGPVQIMQRMSRSNYLIRRPTARKIMKQVVHIQRLKPYIAREMPVGEPELDMHDDFDPMKDVKDLDLSMAMEDAIEMEMSKEFIPHSILDMRHDKELGLLYLVEWENEQGQSWEKATNLVHFKDLIRDFTKKQRELRGAGSSVQFSPSVEVIPAPKAEETFSDQESASLPATPIPPTPVPSPNPIPISPSTLAQPLSSSIPLVPTDSPIIPPPDHTNLQCSLSIHQELENLRKLCDSMSFCKVRESMILLLGNGSSHVPSSSLAYQNETLIRRCKTLAELISLLDFALSRFRTVQVVVSARLLF